MSEQVNSKTEQKPVTNDELLEAVSSYGESGNSKHERLLFLTPRLHIALVEHFRELTKSRHSTLLSRIDALRAGLFALVEFTERYCPESSGRDLYIAKARALLKQP